MEGDERPRQSEPVGPAPSHLLDNFVNILIDNLVDDALLEAMDLRILCLEFISLVCLFFDEVKGHANVAFPLRPKIQEAVRPLQLVQITFNIVVVINILLQLCFPFGALLLIHEILTVHVVEVYSNLGAVGVALAAAWHVICFLIKVKPKILDLNRQVVHILAQLGHPDVRRYLGAEHLLIHDLYEYAVIIVVNIELETLVVYWVLVCLCLRLYDGHDLDLALDLAFEGHPDERLGHLLGKVADLDDVEEALLLELQFLLLLNVFQQFGAVLVLLV